MTFRTLIFRSLRFHARSHLGVVLGAAIGSAVLIGALVVGDSVKESLHEMAWHRVTPAHFAMATGDRFFETSLFERMFLQASNTTFFFSSSPTQPRVTWGYYGIWPGAAVLQLRANMKRQDGEARANNIQLFGVENNFYRTMSDLSPGNVFVNQALARQLNLQVGDHILLRFNKPSALSGDAIFAERTGVDAALRFIVAKIISDDAPADFSLKSIQGPPLNAFVSIEELQKAVGLEDRANLMLVGSTFLTRKPNWREYLRGFFHRDGALLSVGEVADDERGVAVIQGYLQENFRLADVEASLVMFSNEATFELRSRRVFLDSPIVRAAFNAETNSQPLLTYLATLLRAGTNTTPYSMIAAAGAPWTPADMRNDEIILNQWLADDLQAKPGDEISLTYFDPESGARLIEHTNTFRIRGIVPMEMPWADRTLMPDFPGIEKADSTSDWDAGFPLIHKIRAKDEDYWKRFRGTPKAFVTLAAGKKMWANRFGELTAIRFPIPTNIVSEGKAPRRPNLISETNQGVVELRRAVMEKKILANLKPEELGLRFEPVREQALKAAEQSQDFGQLFLGFSFFLIVAALVLMALLFQFGLEQRTTEVGTLLALGFTQKQVRRLLLREGMMLALIGGAIGAVGGIFYAKAMLHGLTTIWRGAVGTSSLHYYASPKTLAIGFLASTIVATLTIWLTLRKQAKRPARELLSEGEDFKFQISNFKSRQPGLSGVLAALSALGALGLVGWAISKGETTNAEIFFSAGAMVLIAGLGFAGAWLKSRAGFQPARRAPQREHEEKQKKSNADFVGTGRLEARPTLTLASLGVRGVARRRKRSLATIAMLACGSFLIVAISAFQLDSNQNATKRSSGTGGFALIGETTMPVVQDLNSKSGRDFFALNERELEGVSFVQFRFHEGDETSCLNLNRAQKPRLLGVKPEMLEGRFGFTKGAGWDVLRSSRRKEALTKSEMGQSLLTSAATAEGEIPAIGDVNSIQWALGKKIGDTIDYTDERGNVFKLRLVGAVANSILQGGLIIDEAEFVKRFPSESGYRMFLIDAPSNRVAEVSATLSRALEDVGLELTPAARRLNEFNAVQNTYLGTFQILGGLGLLLGSAGLGIVVLRNVLERRGELGLLVAVGFQKRALQWMLLSEHGALLGIGLGIGVIAAVVAILPSLISPTTEIPYRSIGITLGAVLLNGALWTWMATRIAVRGNLLAALRNE